MSVRAAGILLHRRGAVDDIEVLIAHMGGPYWASRPERSWSIPKGLVEPGEDDLAAARREFAEELGHPVPDVGFRALGEFRVSSGKTLMVFTAESDLDVTEISSNTFEIEWPPRSGRRQSFPEMDGAGWFGLPDARTKLVTGQVQLLDALERLVSPVARPR